MKIIIVILGCLSVLMHFSLVQFEEQQAFERSRRFLRQLEISFGENPSHYQKIVKALQTASTLTPAGITEVNTAATATFVSVPDPFRDVTLLISLTAEISDGVAPQGSHAPPGRVLRIFRRAPATPRSPRSVRGSCVARRRGESV